MHHHTTPEDVYREVGEYPFDAGGEENIFVKCTNLILLRLYGLVFFLESKNLSGENLGDLFPVAGEPMRRSADNKTRSGEEIFRMENTDANGKFSHVMMTLLYFHVFQILIHHWVKYAISLEGETADLSFDLFV
jgi:hypothetical protein